MKKTLLACVVVVLAGLTACSTLAFRDQALPIDPALTVGKLDNGLTYYVRANSKPQNTAELRLVVNAGSVLEADDQQGFAHFVEHMAFDGTKSFPQADLIHILQSLGVGFGPDLNAYTSFDETVYRLQVPTRDWANVDTGIRILSEWASALTFDDKEIEKERRVIQEEWRSGRGADARIRDIQLPVLLEGSRYAQRLPIGKMDIVERGSAQRLRDFYRSWYRPDLISVVAVGDFDATRVTARIREVFAALSNPPNQTPRPGFEVPDHKGLRVSIVTDPEATASGVALYSKRPPERTRTVNQYRDSIVRSLVVAMLNARFDEVVQSPTSPLLSAGTARSDYVRTMGVTYLAGRAKEGMLVPALSALLTEAERARRFGFTQSELDRQKQAVLAQLDSLYQERDNTPSSSYVREYVSNALDGEPIPGIAYEADLYKRFVPGIGVQEVNALAANWISPDDAVLLASAPAKSGLATPTDAEMTAVFAQVASATLEPYKDATRDEPLLAASPKPAAVVEERHIPSIGVTYWRLSNGAQVYLKPTDFKKDEILFQALCPGGYSLVPDEDYVAAVTAIGVLQESGLGAFSRVELDKKLAGKQVEVSPYLSEIYQGMGGSSSSGDLETLLQLVYLSFTAPRADEQAFRTYRDRALQRADARLSDPDTVFGDTVRLLIANRDSRAEPLTREKLAGMSLQKSLSVYRRLFSSGGDFAFVFVGSFDLASMRPLVETYLGGLPAATGRASWRDRGVTPPQGKVDEAVRLGAEPVSRVQYVFDAAFQWSLDEEVRLEGMSAVLENQLIDVLREQQGGTYSVGVYSSTGKNPRGERRVFIGFGCEPSRVEELAARMFAEIKHLQADGPDAAALQKARETMRRSLELAAQTNTYWAEGLATALRRQEDPQSLLRRVDLINALDSAGIAQEARAALSTDSYIRVVLYPRATP